MATQLGYGVSDVVGSPFDFYTNAAVSGVTGKLATGQSLQMRNNKLVAYITGSALAALTVTLPQSPADGAVAEISTPVGGLAVTALTVAAATNYQATSNITQTSTVSDSLLGTAATAIAANTTLRYEYTLNGDVTNNVAPRTWIRVA